MAFGVMDRIMNPQGYFPSVDGRLKGWKCDEFCMPLGSLKGFETFS